MCSTTEDTCSHIEVQPHVAGLLLTLEAIARSSCSEHAGVIMKAACLLRHAFAGSQKTLPLLEFQIPNMKRLEHVGIS
jgi:hypothetical protein